MTDIYDTLHPVNTPADNLYPNIKPEQNIPDASISKQKLNFSVDGQGAAAILPGEEYVDIAYNGNPGSVLFPKGTYFIYTRDGWLNNTPPYTGTYNTVSEDFEVMAYWYDVSENLIKSSEATPSDDGIILSIPEDDFLVMVLIKNPNENGPRVIPVYSIIPTSLLKYNTRDYDWAALQVTGFTINDGEYPQLGSGYLVDQFSTPVVSANTNYYKICNMKILSADIGRDIVSASAIVWIAATTGSAINTAFVSLNLVMDTQTQDYSASGATFVGGAFDAGKLVYTIEFDADKSELTITLYAALSKDAMLAAGNVCYVRYRDAQGDRQSTVPFFYGTDTGSSAAPEGSEDVHTLGAGKDGDGNQISTTYAKQTGSYPSLMSGGVVATQGSESDDLDDFRGSAYYGKSYYWMGGRNPSNLPSGANGGVLFVQRCGEASTAQIFITNRSSYGTTPPVVYQRSQTSTDTWTDWEEIVTSDGSYPNLGAGYLPNIKIVRRTSNAGWYKIGSVDINDIGNINTSLSVILFINSVYPDQTTGSNAGLSGEIEVDFRTLADGSGFKYVRISILSGNLREENICATYSGTVAYLYYNLDSDYESIQVIKNGEGSNSVTVNAKLPIFNFENTFYGTTAPEGAVYAVNRNMAAYDGDGNGISKTYAPIASPEFTGTPTAPTPPAGDNSKRIATTGWVQSTSGAKTAYHHHIQALIQSTLPEGASNYRAQCYFEIVTDSSAPITTAAELYNALMSLEYNATETRYTPTSGGMWVTTIPEPPTSGVNADVIVGIRATDEYEPQNPETDSRAIVVQQYRVGLSSLDGPFYNVPFYYAGLSTSKSIHDTVTDQYGNYIAGGD